MFSKRSGFQNRFSFRISAITAAFFALASATASLAAEKLVNIKQVQVSENDRVDILLDGRLDPSQVRTEFLNDIIQLSVSDASVYPAKISSVSGKDLSKIFVYQYAPKLVRVRLTVKGRAESFQGKIQVKPSGKLLTIRLDGATSDQVAASAAQARKADSNAASATTNVDAEERALLEKVLKNPVARAAEKASEKAEEAQSGRSQESAAADAPVRKEKRSKAEKSEPLTGRKDSLSPWKMLSSLGGVVLLLGAALFGLRKLAGARSRDGAVGRWVRKSLGRSEKMIEVVSTHHLGPKKSIHMVRVAGRTLVLGVADDSINLITELNGSVNPAVAFDRVPASAGGDEDFLSTLGEQIAQESGRPQGAGSGAIAAGPASYAGGANAYGGAQNSYSGGPQYNAPRTSTRDRIRSRMEGMKQL